MASITLCSVNKEPLSPPNLTKVRYNKDETHLALNILKTSKQVTQKATKEAHLGGQGVPAHPRLLQSGRRGEEHSKAISQQQGSSIPGQHRQGEEAAVNGKCKSRTSAQRALNDSAVQRSPSPLGTLGTWDHKSQITICAGCNEEY